MFDQFITFKGRRYFLTRNAKGVWHYKPVNVQPPQAATMQAYAVHNLGESGGRRFQPSPR